MLMITVLSFGSIIVSADFEEYDDNNTSVVQTAAYDDEYYDDYYDDDYYDNNTSSYHRGTDWFRTIGTSLLVSVIGSAVAVGIVFSRYKFNGKTEPYPYNKKAPLTLSKSEDVHIDTRLEKHKKQLLNTRKDVYYVMKKPLDIVFDPEKQG